MGFQGATLSIFYAHELIVVQYVPPKPDPVLPKKPTKTAPTTSIEVLNPKSVDQAEVANLAAKVQQQAPPETKADDDNDELPVMTDGLREFSKLPIGGYLQSFEFLQKHSDVYYSGASDALLVAAFTAQSNGEGKYARQCVHQSLLLQYCEKLGQDGVRVFFKR